MTARLKIASQDLRSRPKGAFISIIPGDVPFGPNTEPNFIQVTVTGVTREQAHKYVDSWEIDFSHTLVNENATDWRYRVEVDPIYISASSVGNAELKSQMQLRVTRPGTPWEGCQVVNFSPSSMMVDIPKNGVWQTAKGLLDVFYLSALKRDFSDHFRTVFRIDRYYFAEADVDTFIAAGRAVTLTKAEALSMIIDRLDE